jgi:hypothetical protein
MSSSLQAPGVEQQRKHRTAFSRRVMSGVPQHFRFIERHDIGGIEARTQRMTAQIGFGRRRTCRQLRVLCAVVRPQLILRQQAQPVGPQALRQQSARMTLEEHRDRVGRRLIEVQAKTVVLDVRSRYKYMKLVNPY